MDLLSPAVRRRAASARRFLAGPALLLALATGLAGCAGDGSLPGLAPPQTEVPTVEAGNFPTLGAPPADRREPLTAEQQQKLQRDLESLARRQQAQ